MCGIVGFVQTQQAPADVLTAMLAAVRHRGPDAQGRFHTTAGPYHVELGHTRLSIINLSGGAQPMSDAGACVTYNGEVYNYRSLRAALEARGRVFKTSSDTEVVLHQVSELGATEAALRALNGFFAFAHWQKDERRLVLARDRAGIKPLFYAQLPDGGIAFGSELTALLAHPAIAPRLDPVGLCSYLFSDYVHAPHSLVRGIRKLPPGHYLVWQDGRIEAPRPFWQPRAPNAGAADLDSLARNLWSRLELSTERALIADVPVGVFLSGGIDSSVLATLAVPLAERRMQAFSVGFREASYDESRYARVVADSLHVEHVVDILDEARMLATVEAALATLDEPLADPSYLPTYLLSELASKHVKVVIGGDGGDELFGGYATYVAHQYARLYKLVPARMRSAVIERALSLLPIDDRYQSFEWKARRFTGRFADDPFRRHLRWLSSVDLPDLERLVSPALLTEPATLSAAIPDGPDTMSRLLAFDLQTYLPGSILTKVDRASMAHGLEVRPPLLENDLVDWALSLPSTVKVRGRRTKIVFKHAARAHLARSVMQRPKKGFGVPLGAWLRGPLHSTLQALEHSSPLWDLGIERDVFSRWLLEHRERRRDHAKALWALFVLDRWARRNRIVQ